MRNYGGRSFVVNIIRNNKCVHASRSRTVNIENFYLPVYFESWGFALEPDGRSCPVSPFDRSSIRGLPNIARTYRDVFAHDQVTYEENDLAAVAAPSSGNGGVAAISCFKVHVAHNANCAVQIRGTQKYALSWTSARSAVSGSCAFASISACQRNGIVNVARKSYIFVVRIRPR
jgi:hypothetical protein